ncbi:MAG: hypothetical protein UY10_C0013G0010 [Microgenomates group bacterium GW2011_GWA2_47_8]|nr:MAG: hypothetical protein UY10_C0013G0010 [Microgenomates group bacterium GW2011_GWA2_47_8]
MASVGEILRILLGTPDPNHPIEQDWEEVKPKLEELDRQQARANASQTAARKAFGRKDQRGWVSGRPHDGQMIQEGALDESTGRPIPARRP